MPFTRKTGLTKHEAEIIHRREDPLEAYAVVQTERTAGRLNVGEKSDSFSEYVTGRPTVEEADREAKKTMAVILFAAFGFSMGIGFLGGLLWMHFTH